MSDNPGKRLMGILFGLIALAGLTYGLYFWFNPSVVIRWNTESELDTIGFNLYRGESPDGEFIKVNEQLIPAGEDPLAGGQYSFTDFHVKAGRRYYYLLEDVNAEGIANRYGPEWVEPVGWADLALSGFLVLGGGLGLGLLIARRKVMV